MTKRKKLPSPVTLTKEGKIEISFDAFQALVEQKKQERAERLDQKERG